MKKIILMAVAIVCVMSMASCKKECVCKVTQNGETVWEQTYELNSGEKCADYEMDAGFGVKAKCK